MPIGRIKVPAHWDMVRNYPWFEDLKKDIEKNGLASPLFVRNRQCGIERLSVMEVKTGQTRIRALHDLGWTHVPVLLIGEKPADIDGTPISTMEEFQSYLGDGKACILHDYIHINQCKVPENRKYPQTERRYPKCP